LPMTTAGPDRDVLSKGSEKAVNDNLTIRKCV
jgi:hypothetical protein